MEDCCSIFIQQWLLCVAGEVDDTDDDAGDEESQQGVEAGLDPPRRSRYLGFVCHCQ